MTALRAAAIGRDEGRMGAGLDWRFIDWIWHVRGSLPLAPGQSGDEAFDRLEPLFQQGGTSFERAGDTLTFRKWDQAAQDKMAIFDGGVLTVEPQPAGAVLRYRLKSRALLACFLAPLLFLAFAQLTIVLGTLEGPATEEADKKKDEAKPDPVQHPLDVMLGAPAPEKPKKDKKDKDDKHSPTTAYVFAGLFAALYVAGRILEDRLVKRLFRKRLSGA